MTLKSFDRTISIHSLRMEGDIQILACNWEIQFISIHSLRMEGDILPIYMKITALISIHSLRMEGDGNGNALV